MKSSSSKIHNFTGPLNNLHGEDPAQLKHNDQPYPGGPLGNENHDIGMSNNKLDNVSTGKNPLTLSRCLQFIGY